MIYSISETGKLLTSEEAIHLILAEEMDGFMTKSDLQTLLNQQNCVGIRIYNAIESEADTRKRVMAVGIRGNGTEKDGRGGVGYLMSQPFSATNPTNGVTLDGREEATDKVNLGTDLQVFRKYSSVFSAAAIHLLLADKDGQEVIGIGFFNNDFMFEEELGVFRSHIGVSMVGSSNVQRVAGDIPFSHIQSEKPCPGFCATLAHGVTEVSATAETENTIDTDSAGIYVVKWTKPPR